MFGAARLLKPYYSHEKSSSQLTIFRHRGSSVSGQFQGSRLAGPRASTLMQERLFLNTEASPIPIIVHVRLLHNILLLNGLSIKKF